MTHVLIIARDDETKSKLRKSLAHYDLSCSFTSYSNGVWEAVNSGKPDILLFEMDENPPASEIWELTRRVKRTRNLPVIALIPGEMPGSIDSLLDIGDFVAAPYNSTELILRINRLLHRTESTESKEQIKHNDLKIDLITCEVTVEGKIVELTFKEYELLKLLAGNPGRVYTRDALLDKIWGYDYFGGDRTVDVHIRRLRSKIEDPDHTFIETVRNIGYRFIKNS
ncbi:MAG: response regulator transcription factor [Dehalococcoidales bacterium]|nr:response regulator transcription factor [Dehalococcoidales bacterium]